MVRKINKRLEEDKRSVYGRENCRRGYLLIRDNGSRANRSRKERLGLTVASGTGDV